MSNQTYWLLERKQLGNDGKPRYYSRLLKDGGYQLTDDAYAAFRWHTRKEARQARDKFIMPAHRNWFKPTEHIFSDRKARRMSWFDKMKSWLMRG